MEEKNKIELEKDTLELQTNLELGIAMIDFMKVRCHDLSPEKKKNIENQIDQLLIPSSFKNISAEKLKEFLILDYISKASRTMIEAWEERKPIFPIKNRDIDLIVDLQKIWKSKDIKSEVKEGITRSLFYSIKLFLFFKFYN
jgi:hypothetical protein